MIAGWIGERQVDRRHQPAARHARADLQVGDLLRIPCEPVGQVAPRPIVFPSMIPETDSDSATSADMSARRRCCSVVILRRILPTRRVSPQQRHEHQRDPARRARGCTSPPSQRARRGVRGDRRRRRRDDVVKPTDVVGDPRLDFPVRVLREERQRHPLQAVIHGSTEIVHHTLADDVGDVGVHTPAAAERIATGSSPVPPRSGLCRRA